MTARRAAVLAAAGLFTWLVTIVVPGSAMPGPPSPVAYVVWLMVAGGAAGYAGWHPAWLAAVALAAPAFVTVPWLAPRGDYDRLWLLYFPAIVFWGGLAGLAHAVGARRRRRRRL